jgi:hypothetical protein
MIMPERISDHRLGAFIYGFVSGIGLLMIIWGLASIAMLPSANLMMNIGLVLFGVTLLACGGCREAYLRGNLSAIPESRIHAERNRPSRPSTTGLISEQVIGTPEEVASQESHES